MLKSLLSNKEKLIELANTPLNENCLAVILKKLPKKLGDPRKFLIPYGFSKLKCKALADLGASINLMPLSVWKELGLPELISTQMTLELANRDICTPKGIARDVFVLIKNSLDDNLMNTYSRCTSTDEHALDYSSPPLWDDYDDELFDLETVNDDTYDDPFYSKEEKIKDSKILIDELDPLSPWGGGLSDFLPFPECDSVFYEDFSEV
ncbi:reverse transcriptase domain-containing protein [Tanacetum coccineum]